MVLTVPAVMHHPIGNLHPRNRDLLRPSGLRQNTVPGLSEKVATFSDGRRFTQHSIFTCVHAYLHTHTCSRSRSLSLATMRSLLNRGKIWSLLHTTVFLGHGFRICFSCSTAKTSGARKPW